MKVIYEVYQREGAVSSAPIVTYQGEPISSPRYKRKFAGKKAKIEAVKKLVGHQIPANASTAEVNAFINEQFFGTSKWNAYHEAFQKAANEQELVIDQYIFLYYLEVELADNMPVDPDDARLIQMINEELAGERVMECRGLINPICSISIASGK